MSRRLGAGLAAAWAGLTLYLAGGAVVAAPGVGALPWAAPPPGFVHPALRRVALPLPPGDWREAARAASQYRWRPLAVPRAAPPSRRMAWAPPHARPMPSWRPPAVFGHAGLVPLPPPPVHPPYAGPMVVSLDGQTYRFRPTPPIYLPPPDRRLLPPALAGQRPWSAAPAAWPVVRPDARPWSQPAGLPAADGRFAYRFRPDPRFSPAWPGHSWSGHPLGQARSTAAAGFVAQSGGSWYPPIGAEPVRVDAVAYVYN